jgi:hypothetical protein
MQAASKYLHTDLILGQACIHESADRPRSISVLYCTLAGGGGRHRGLEPPTLMKGGAEPPSFATANHMLIMQFSLFFLNMGRRPHFSPLTFFVVSPPLSGSVDSGQESCIALWVCRLWTGVLYFTLGLQTQDRSPVLHSGSADSGQGSCIALWVRRLRTGALVFCIVTL